MNSNAAHLAKLVTTCCFVEYAARESMLSNLSNDHKRARRAMDSACWALVEARALKIKLGGAVIPYSPSAALQREYVLFQVTAAAVALGNAEKSFRSAFDVVYPK